MRLIGTLMLTMVWLLPVPALAEEEIERFTDGDPINQIDQTISLLIDDLDLLKPGLLSDGLQG